MKNPKLIPTPFAKNGMKNTIPENYESSLPANQATWDIGFGQSTMIPVSVGGLPPQGQDFNGVLNTISENINYLSNGGRFKFDENYAKIIGGYAKGAILQSDDEEIEYQSLVDNNTVNFNTATAAEVKASWMVYINAGDSKETKTNVAELWRRSLAEAGFNFLGYYKNGPFTINATDAVVYGGKAYKLSSGLSQLKTTGTSASSFANDEKSLVLMDGDTLRKELSASNGVYLVGGVTPIWRVGDHGGAYGAGVDISAAFNATAAQKGNSPGEIVLPPVNGILLVASDSLRVPKNTILDLQGNTIKLADGASKYILRNRDEKTFGGSLTVKNGIIDGNKQGGQKRRYDKPVKNANGLTIYDYRDNYAGFSVMFSYVENLYVSDIEVKNSDGWGIAHFKCGDATFERCKFNSTEEVGSNADGITGVGTRRTTINSLTGYTNDDMCAISASRATVQGYAIFDPLEGNDIESFTVNGLNPVKKGNLWPHVGVGIYVSDGFTINLVTLRNFQGLFNLYVARFGNYWAGSQYNAPDGIIKRVLVDNSFSVSYTPGNSDLYTFHVNIYNFDITGSGTRKESTSKDAVMAKNSPLFKAGEGSLIGYLNLDNAYYLNNTETDSGDRHSIVETDINGEIKDITLSVEMTFPLDDVDKNTIFKKNDSKLTTLNVIKASIGSPSILNANLPMSEENLFINKGTGQIRIGTCFNAKIRKDLSLPAGMTALNSKGVVSVYRFGMIVGITGYAKLPSSYNGSRIVIGEIPVWASAFAETAYANVSIDSSLCRLRVNVSDISIDQGPSSGSTIFLDGAAWEATHLLSSPK